MLECLKNTSSKSQYIVIFSEKCMYIQLFKKYSFQLTMLLLLGTSMNRKYVYKLCPQLMEIDNMRI